MKVHYVWCRETPVNLPLFKKDDKDKSLRNIITEIRDRCTCIKENPVIIGTWFSS